MCICARAHSSIASICTLLQHINAHLIGVWVVYSLVTSAENEQEREILTLLLYKTDKLGHRFRFRPRVSLSLVYLAESVLHVIWCVLFLTFFFYLCSLLSFTSFSFGNLVHIVWCRGVAWFDVVSGFLAFHFMKNSLFLRQLLRARPHSMAIQEFKSKSYKTHLLWRARDVRLTRSTAICFQNEKCTNERNKIMTIVMITIWCLVYMLIV